MPVNAASRANPIAATIQELYYRLGEAAAILTGLRAHSIEGSVAAANDATPTVYNKSYIQTANTAPTTISTFDDGVDGQEVWVQFNDAFTTVDFTGTDLHGNAGVDWITTNGDYMLCKRIGSYWHCIIGLH
jgi:hypothetical protein